MKKVSWLIAMVLLFGCGGGGSGGNVDSSESSGGVVAASKIIDATGGVVEVTDTKSPLFGVKVGIFEATLTEAEEVKIEVPDTYPSLPNNLTQVGPVVELKCSRSVEFSKPVMVRIPVKGDVTTGDTYHDVATYNETTGTWEQIGSQYDYEAKEMVFFTNHFSKSAPIKAPLDPAPTGDANTGFDMRTDTLEMENWQSAPDCPELQGNLCYGIIAFTKWYYEFNSPSFGRGPGLRLHYKLSTAEKVACEASRNYMGFYIKPDIADALFTFFTSTPSHTAIVKLMQDVLGGGGNLVVQLTAFKFIWESLTPTLISHAFLVYQWVSQSGSPHEGYFLAYDPENHSIPVKLRVELINQETSLQKIKVVYPENFSGFKYEDLDNFVVVWESADHIKAVDVYLKYKPDEWRIEGETKPTASFQGELSGSLWLNAWGSFEYNWSWIEMKPEGNIRYSNSGEGIWRLMDDTLQLEVGQATYKGKVDLDSRRLISLDESNTNWILRIDQDQ